MQLNAQLPLSASQLLELNELAPAKKAAVLAAISDKKGSMLYLVSDSFYESANIVTVVNGINNLTVIF
jgi:hypothetical protein